MSVFFSGDDTLMYTVRTHTTMSECLNQHTRNSYELLRLGLGLYDLLAAHAQVLFTDTVMYFWYRRQINSVNGNGYVFKFTSLIIQLSNAQCIRKSRLQSRWKLNQGRSQGRTVSLRSRLKPNRGRPIGYPATNKFSLLQLYFFFFFG